MEIKNRTILITYPDSMGGSLSNLEKVLNMYFPGMFQGGIHLLPPFPSSADRGFAPQTHTEIDPQFGGWSDISSLGQNGDIMLDLIVNHISSESKAFMDFLENGRQSVHADMFLTIGKIWADGLVDDNDVSKVFGRRSVPYSEYTIKRTGCTEKIWTTFGKKTPSEQVDLDVNSSITKDYFQNIIETYRKHEVKLVRLDAAGYVIKKPGTECFFEEPEIFGFLEWLRDLAASKGMVIVPEIHSHRSIQFRLAERGYWIYDFVLPFLILDAMVQKEPSRLCRYLKERPIRQFTMLDCHDGIPVKPDLDGFIDGKDAEKTVSICLGRGANLSRILAPSHIDPTGFDVHQIRCTYYTALGCNDDAYIAARAIQLFTPGIPMVYYVGLLAGANDYHRVDQTGDGREINRHNYSISEIENSIQTNVVQRLLRLIRFRNEYPAFDGEFDFLNTPGDQLLMRWRNEKWLCSLFVNLEKPEAVIEYISKEREIQSFTV